MNWLVTTSLRLRVLGRPRPRVGQLGRVASCRPFTLLDGMILVGGAAVGLAALRGPFGVYSPREEWKSLVHPFMGAVLIFSAAIMLIFRLRRPRPPIWRISSQPGTVACFAMVAFSSAATADRWLDEDCSRGLFMIQVSILEWSETFLSIQQPLLAWGVVVSWTLLALGRRWRSEPGWIDGTGRALGWAWIVWGLSGLILTLFERYSNSITVPINGVSPT
jgi:hypothetical protein